MEAHPTSRQEVRRRIAGERLARTLYTQRASSAKGLENTEQAASLVDFAFRGGLMPGNLEQLDELAKRGVVGYVDFATFWQEPGRCVRALTPGPAPPLGSAIEQSIQQFLLHRLAMLFAVLRLLAL